MRSRHSPLSTQSISVHSNPSLKTTKKEWLPQVLSIPPCTKFQGMMYVWPYFFWISFSLQPQSLNIKKDVVLATDVSTTWLEGVLSANVISASSKTWNAPYFIDFRTCFPLNFYIVMFSEFRCVVFLLLAKLTHFFKGKNECPDPFLSALHQK